MDNYKRRRSARVPFRRRDRSKKGSFSRSFERNAFAPSLRPSITFSPWECVRGFRPSLKPDLRRFLFSYFSTLDFFLSFGMDGIGRILLLHFCLLTFHALDRLDFLGYVFNNVFGTR